MRSIFSMLSALSLSCVASPTPPLSPVVPPATPAKKTEAEPPSPSKSTIKPIVTLKTLELETSLPSTLKHTWPPQKWTSAKAYSYNFVPYGPKQKPYIYNSKGWNDKIKTTVDLTEEEARYALKMVHHTAGSIETSKCTFPRHGIVYLNEQDEPIASISYCHSCEGLLIWPPYSSDPEANMKKYDIMAPLKPDRSYPEPLVIQAFYETIPYWNSLFFERLNLENPTFRP